jgi:hypothetical protein
MIFKNRSQAKKQLGLSYLGGINISAKIEKNKKVFNQRTYSLYLSPAKISGYNTCIYATPECKLGCLNTSGRAGMEHGMDKKTITNARIKKTKLFFEQTEFFMNWLVAEIKAEQQKAIKYNEGFSVRLNCTSDIDWARVYLNNKNIFEIFPNVDFYDYTKNPNKFDNKPENYHLTFSYTGRNWDKCEELLNKGHNIAVVFNIGKKDVLPETFRGYKVVDGDISDYRIADEKGVVIGLIWKNIGDKVLNNKIKNSIFAIQKAELLTTKKEVLWAV